MDVNYQQFTDEELIMEIQKGDQDATEYLIKKYSPLVKKCTRTVYLIGADSEDLTQEGMIGLFKAIQSFEQNNKASFFTFARLCINRQIYTAIKASNRKKHSPLNSYISLYSTDQEDSFELIENLEAGTNSNPEHIILDQENTSRIEELLEANLSKMEKEILPLYLDGMSYADIAEQTGKNTKSIENTITRIREKVRRFYPFV